MIKGYINLWSEKINQLEEDLKGYKTALKHLESPFNFIQGFQMQQEVKKEAEEKA